MNTCILNHAQFPRSSQRARYVVLTLSSRVASSSLIVHPYSLKNKGSTGCSLTIVFFLFNVVICLNSASSAILPVI